MFFVTFFFLDFYFTPPPSPSIVRIRFPQYTRCYVMITSQKEIYFHSRVLKLFFVVCLLLNVKGGVGVNIKKMMMSRVERGGESLKIF